MYRVSQSYFIYRVSFFKFLCNGCPIHIFMYILIIFHVQGSILYFYLQGAFSYFNVHVDPIMLSVQEAPIIFLCTGCPIYIFMYRVSLLYFYVQGSILYFYVHSVTYYIKPWKYIITKLTKISYLCMKAISSPVLCRINMMNIILIRIPSMYCRHQST